MNLLEEQLNAQKQKRDYAVVTVIKTDGSTPRHSGSKMMVFSDSSIIGTIGGGAIETLAIKDAVECINANSNSYKKYDLAPENKDLSMACGGDMEVFIEVYRNKPLLVMCGAGHVGKALIQLAKMLEFEVMLVDNRALSRIQDTIELADEFVPVDDFEEGVGGLEVDPGAYFVIATWGHKHDRYALKGALLKHAAYIGVIGSREKIAVMFDMMLKEGYSKEQLNDIYTPIGLDIGSETPMEIALAIMAEILCVKNNATGKSLKDL